MAFRIAVELVAGLAVGVAIGWVLDRWLGTGPWLLVLFFFLGAAAGVLNVYRSAKALGLSDERGTPPEDESQDRER
ncbi:MAG: AtpZ/AtpI family protein [Alphaproteobacteria bacterium]